MAENPRSSDALLIVDPQVDFCPGGALPAPGGDLIFPALNRASTAFPLVVASRDWHPPDHCSFQAQGGPWPVHCVAGSPGAEFYPALNQDRISEIFSKGTHPDRDAYSAFDDTGLAAWLHGRGVHRLFVGGLTVDYCVRASVLDALELGFEVVILEDAVRAVDVHPGDGEHALQEARAAGVRVQSTVDLC
ncbi:MAG: nicotinamidase [Candidatus Dormibacteraeota bacterium]|nr:nicotinamidase [Candidatus Dormibacteraeota bacterium]